MMYEFPQVGFVEAFKLFWLNYVNFKGRSRRSEYWWVMLWHVIIASATGIVSIIMIFIPIIGPFIAIILWLLLIVYSLAAFIPNLALLVRRFHDRNMTMFLPIFSVVLSVLYNFVYFMALITSGDFMSTDHLDSANASYEVEPSGWLYASLVLLFVIIIIEIINFIITVLDSHKTANKYGPSPKYTQQAGPPHQFYAQPQSTMYQEGPTQSHSSVPEDMPTHDNQPTHDDTQLTDLDDLERGNRKPQDDPYKY